MGIRRKVKFNGYPSGKQRENRDRERVVPEEVRKSPPISTLIEGEGVLDGLSEKKR